MYRTDIILSELGLLFIANRNSDLCFTFDFYSTKALKRKDRQKCLILQQIVVNVNQDRVCAFAHLTNLACVLFALNLQTYTL